MKNLITSFLIVAFLIGGWLIFDNYSRNVTGALAEVLKEDIIPFTEAESWDKASASYDIFEEEWDKYRKISLAFLENDQINEIELCVARAEKYIEAEDVSNSAGELCSIARQLELLDKREKITLSNIL